MADVLLTTKLHIPPLRPNCIPRQQLYQCLSESHARMVLISAPAGYGKTTLAAAWGSAAGDGCAWLSLDAADNDPRLLLEYLQAALATRRPELAAAGTEGESLLERAAELINRLDLDMRPLTLVMDDYQWIDSPAANELVSYFLDHLPRHVRLLVLTRCDSALLPVARLRARGELLELRAADLRFSLEESAAFLHRCLNVLLPAEETTALHREMGGWVAGLQLAVLRLERPVTSRSLARQAAPDGHIGAYFMEEVFRQQSRDVQRFLLRTSLLDEVSAELAQSIQDSAVRLHEIEQANLFLTAVDAERRCYAYHPLFLRFLRMQAAASLSAEETRLVHERAAMWFESREKIPSAVRHALHAGRQELAADWIERHADQALWQRGEALPLRDLQSAFSDGFLARRPRLALQFASVLLVTGETDEAERLVKLAEQSAEQGLLGSELLPEMRATQAVLMRLRGELQPSIELSRQALGELSENRTTLRALLLFNVGVADLKSGRLTASSRALGEALLLAELHGNIVLQLMSLYWLALIEFEWGHISAARGYSEEGLQLAAGYGAAVEPFMALIRRGYAELLYEVNELDAAGVAFAQCIEIGERCHLAEVSAYGWMGQGRLALVRGVESRGRQYLQQGRRLLTERGHPEEARRATALHVKALLRHGDLAQAGRWAGVSGLSLGDRFTSPESFLYYSVLARYWIHHSRARHDPSCLPEVLALIARMLAVAESGECVGLSIRALILQSLAYDSLGQSEQSLYSLKQALFLAAPGGYVRTFLDEGPAMLALLQRAAEAGMEPVYARRLLDHAAGSAPPDLNSRQAGWLHPHDALTEREGEVLRLIASGLSNEEIAAQLVVTINTVRTHIKSINRKFGVRSRTQAIYQAQRMGLLGD